MIVKFLYGAVIVLLGVVLILAAINIFKSAGTKSQQDETKNKWRKKAEENFWTILLALAGVAIFFWKIYTPGLEPAKIGGWSWSNWLWILAFCSIVIALARINAQALGAAATALQVAVVIAIFVLFIGFPAVFAVKDWSLPQVTCPDVSAYQTRSCVLNTKWSSWIGAAEGAAANGMQICFTPGIEFERQDVNGTVSFRFKTKEGRSVVAYRLCPGGWKCPETLPP